MNHTINTDERDKYEGKNILPTDEDESLSGTFDETLLLADTLAEDRDRYQDVVRDLIEFEEAHVQGEAEAITDAGEFHDMDARHEISVS